MTPLDLLNSLREYCEIITKDMIMPARVPENGTEAGKRAPKVYVGNLPNKEAEKKEAPYILLKLLTKNTDAEETICRVRIICVTFSEDKQENYIQCLNLLTEIERKLLEDGVVGIYYVQKPIESIIYDDDLEIYQIGEMMTIWELPQITRNIREYL